MDVRKAAYGRDRSEELALLVAPFANLWKVLFYDLPTTMGTEITKFAAHRLRAQAELLSRLKRCKTVGDVIEAQTDFLQDSALSYTDEADRLVDDVTAAVVPGKPA